MSHLTPANQQLFIRKQFPSVFHVVANSDRQLVVQFNHIVHSTSKAIGDLTLLGIPVMSRKQSIARNKFPIALLLIRYNQNWFIKINPKWCFTVRHCGDFAFSVWTMFWNYFLPRIPVATNIRGKKWTRNKSITSFRIVPGFSDAVLRRLLSRRWAVAVTHLHVFARSQRLLMTLHASCPVFHVPGPSLHILHFVQLAFLLLRPVHFLYAHDIELVICVMSTDHWWWNLFEKLSQVGWSCGVADRVWNFWLA